MDTAGLPYTFEMMVSAPMVTSSGNRSLATPSRADGRPGANAMALKELSDPAALAEELLLTIEVCHDNGRSAPVDGNFALGGRGTIRSADRISRELFEEAPEIDVVVVDISLRDFGRADVAPGVLAQDCVRPHRCG